MASAASIQLSSGATGSSTQFAWPGGMGVFAVVATFNGATIKLQFVGPDGSTLIDAGTNTTLTANGAGIFYLPPVNIQCTVVSGPPSGVYASASRVVY